jgi:hypothetical protein
MLSYRFFAKTYGWTPQQVDELSEDCYEWIPKVEQAHARVTEMKQREAEREARAAQRRTF